MDEDDIPDTSMTTGHGTFVEDTGDVRGHRSVVKQNMSSGKVTEDQFSHRTRGRYSEVIFESGHHDSSSL